MHEPPRTIRRWAASLPRAFILPALAAVLAIGCASSATGGSKSSAAPAEAPAQVATVLITTPSAPRNPAHDALDTVPAHFEAPVPVNHDDGFWGSPVAPATIVVFTDYECPFCARLQATLQELGSIYGQDRLRIVVKHNPLPFHRNAKDAAIAAEAVRALGGNKAFWAFTSMAFGDQRSFSSNPFDQWARAAGVDGDMFRAELRNPAHAEKVHQDMALAKQLGVRGTPHSFVNGASISGAQPSAKFREVIDDHLKRADELIQAGSRPGEVYLVLAKENFQQAPAPDARPSEPPAPDTTVYKVPIGTAPILGPRNALVTIVMFADFQCPFCARVSKTVAELMTRYPNDVRLVWKDQPLPFHNRARPAAIFAREARAQRGDAAFWSAYNKLFENSRSLDDADLEQYARELGLNVNRVRNSLASNAFSRQINDDVDLAGELKASGTPHFFINGRRLVGAQPIEKFAGIVDEELQKARALVGRGVPASQVYDRLQRDAVKPTPTPVERKTVPSPTAAQPWRGARYATIVIHQFSDFQCPFSARAEPTIAEIEKKYPGRIKIVWHNLPLPFHPRAQSAAEAAYEAFTQRGNDGFWRYHSKLFEHQRAPGGLERPALEAYAVEIGLDLTRFRQALDTNHHAPAVRADLEIAKGAGIQGTPGFVINGYFIGGAQQQAAFERIIDPILRGRAP